MPTNPTLDGVPDEVYERLKAAAAVNHRSLNSQIIAVLEAQVLPRRLSAQEHLAAIRAARARLDALGLFQRAADLIDREEYEVDSAAVLRLGEASGCCVHDCEYVALAEFLDVALVTADKKRARAFAGRARLLGRT